MNIALGNKSGLIGVDPGAAFIKLAQLRSTGDEVELIAAGAMEVPTELRDVSSESSQASRRFGFITQAVKDVVKQNDFRGRQCVVSIPSKVTFVHHVRTDKLPPVETAIAVREELRNKLPYAVEDAIIRYEVAGDVFGEDEPQREVIVVAVRKSDVYAYLNAMRKARLDVVGVSIEASALVECFGRLFRRATDADRAVLFIDMGASSTQVALSHGQHLVFARNLPYGGADLDDVVAKGLKISPAQANAMRRDLLDTNHTNELKEISPDDGAGYELYRLMDSALGMLSDELTQCLRYYESVFRNQTVERVIFVGGQAYDKRLCQALARRLNLPAQVGDPLIRVRRIKGAGMGIGLDRREPQPDWAVAVGLSLGKITAA